MVGATGEAKGPPPSGARGRRRIKLAAAFAGALVVASAGQAARAQGDQVDVRVLNRSWEGKAIVVRVYDLVCRRVIFEGEILHNASVLVPGCPDEGGLVTIAVVDRFGHRQTYPGLTGSSTVEVEFR